MQFGQILRVLRTASGIGLRELARKLEISPSYLSLVENGKMGPPSSERITQIAQALQLSPSVMMNIAGIVDTRVLDFLYRTPEASELLRAAMEIELRGPELGALARLLSSGGREALERLLAQAPGTSGAGTSGAETLAGKLDSLLVMPSLGCRTRAALFEALAELVVAHHPQMSAENVIAALRKRERQASTAVGDGVALPHARMPGLQESIVVLARSPEGIAFPAKPPETVFIVFLLLSPEETHAHLELLSQIAELCFKEGVVAQLRACLDEDALRALLRRHVEPSAEVHGA